MQEAVGMSFKAKFRWSVATAGVGLLLLASLWLGSVHARLTASKKQQIQNLVQIAYSTTLQYYRMEVDGKVSREEAQKRALETLESMHYEGDNYFWVADLHPTMIMHPIRPELNGKDLREYRDADGKALFLEMVHAVKSHGAGFISYKWPRPGQADGRPVPKLSFARHFEPWGWMIGTGIYVDDVDTAWRESAAQAGGVAVLCLSLLLVACFTV